MRASQPFLKIGTLVCLCLMVWSTTQVSTAEPGAPPNVPAQAPQQPVYLPLIAGSTNPGAVPSDGATALPIALLGEEVPVAGAKTFFKDSIFNSTGDLAIWIPPNAKTVRGIFFQNGSPIRPNPSDPDWRNTVAQDRELAARQLASMWGFAYVSGAVWRDDLRDFTGQEALFHAALEEFATTTGHAELRYAPLVIHGGSRMSGFGPDYALKHPERVITYVMVVAGTDEASTVVPGMMIVGERDDGAGKINSRFFGNRANGALLSAAMMWKAEHECNRCGDLGWPYMDHMIRERLPRDADLRSGPVTLKTLREQDGWLGDVANWGDVYPYDQYPGDKSKAAWFPNRSVAYLWRNFVRQTPPATINWPTTPYSWSNGFTQQPAPLFKKETRDISASKPFKIVAVLSQTVAGSIHFYDGDVDLGVGVVSADGKSVQLDAVTVQPGMHTFIVMQDGQPIAWPAGIIVLP